MNEYGSNYGFHDGEDFLTTSSAPSSTSLPMSGLDAPESDELNAAKSHKSSHVLKVAYGLRHDCLFVVYQHDASQPVYRARPTGSSRFFKRSSEMEYLLCLGSEKEEVVGSATFSKFSSKMNVNVHGEQVVMRSNVGSLNSYYEFDSPILQQKMRWNRQPKSVDLVYLDARNVELARIVWGPFGKKASGEIQTSSTRIQNDRKAIDEMIITGMTTIHLTLCKMGLAGGEMAVMGLAGAGV